LIACGTVDAIEPDASACASGECVVFVNDKPPAAEALCNGAGITIRWTVGENVFLTTCEDGGTSAQQRSNLAALIHQYAFLPVATPDTVKAQTQPSPREQTLCDDREEIYFSCPLENGKTVSVCARNNTGPDRGYLQYRYGTKDGTFVFPDQSVPPAKTIAITDVSEGSIRGLHLEFSRGLYTYVVSSVSPGEICVVKNGKILFDNHCGASIYKNFSNEIFDGVNEAPVSKVDIH
jgi:hypothetical protein